MGVWILVALVGIVAGFIYHNWQKQHKKTPTGGGKVVVGSGSNESDDQIGG